MKSLVINKQRILKMQARYELVEELKRLLLEALKQRLNNRELYAKYLHNFIVQVFIALSRACSE